MCAGEGGMRVFYRRQGDEAFVSLPLQLAPSGRWIGEVPGSWSENEDGFTFEYYVTTFDREGSLLIAQGDETAPAPEPAPITAGVPSCSVIEDTGARARAGPSALVHPGGFAGGAAEPGT